LLSEHTTLHKQLFMQGFLFLWGLFFDCYGGEKRSVLGRFILQGNELELCVHYTAPRCKHIQIKDENAGYHQSFTCLPLGAVKRMSINVQRSARLGMTEQICHRADVHIL